MSGAAWATPLALALALGPARSASAPAPGAPAPATPARAVRVLPRPELPWVVAVCATDAPAQAEAERRALEEAGGHLATLRVRGVPLVRAEGPPEAEALVLAAARALAHGAAIFVEGRVTLRESGALPPGRAPPAPPLRGAPAEKARVFVLPLPFARWLTDLEGEALRRAVARALARRGAYEVALQLDERGARLVLSAADAREPATDEVRGALREVADAPLAPRALAQLLEEASAERAQARATLGRAAEEAAVAAYWFGAAAAPPADDGGARLRAALIPEVLAAAPPASPAP